MQDVSLALAYEAEIIFEHRQLNLYTYLGGSYLPLYGLIQTCVRIGPFCMLADISIGMFLSSKYNARWFCGRVVSVLAYEAGDPGSNPGSGLNGYCSSSIGLDWIIGEVMARTVGSAGN